MTALPRRYLLHGLIAPGELSLWWGAPKCGKSFLLLRIAYGLALGIGLWGRQAAGACRVLYVAAEGEGGFAARLLGLRNDMGDAGDAFRYIAQRATVGPPADDLADVIAAALDMGAGLIVLDTLARTFGDGDENAARDMGGFVNSVDRLRTETSRPSRGDPPRHQGRRIVARFGRFDRRRRPDPQGDARG
jgi:RecA-family ATPase